jgi:hypothetical protein
MSRAADVGRERLVMVNAQHPETFTAVRQVGGDSVIEFA